jgi:hypothetical protein
MNDPIVVWPPGTFVLPCPMFGPYYECTQQFPWYAENGYAVCCLA